MLGLLCFAPGCFLSACMSLAACRSSLVACRWSLVACRLSHVLPVFSPVQLAGPLLVCMHEAFMCDPFSFFLQATFLFACMLPSCFDVCPLPVFLQAPFLFAWMLPACCFFCCLLVVNLGTHLSHNTLSGKWTATVSHKWVTTVLHKGAATVPS